MSTKTFWTLQAEVIVRESAAWLADKELTKLAESCEATAHMDRTPEWARKFAIPLIRELGSRIEGKATSHETKTLKAIVETVEKIRALDRRKVADLTAVERRRQIKTLTTALDIALAGRNQTELFDE
ncbi:hypothetical protein [Aureliella helgolandensis]|uniref:Uncharacterized protein n=1 Tax=Aureliella helgolandensis TaxID=2527968 RepID=A0A518G755_9BACT|nr:hypothetical protein [Aureliella helgolandensis]QDV24413.1 hypothetical protein Q31a_27300 [Aureliella helgolandensis]